ncbi:serine hydrolase [Streptomyces sp. HNM0645]|uniref:serine hydrolase n=1 Tax=Streptomyces sp. HNM0645 TaxID=2782343 RepID=UPI0024B6B1AB|nr:serine hydrolase [Streptomyces sp. HNM0645]MDI9884657.1 serine hydrolase [Streptomyces sp. HNM0645]
MARHRTPRRSRPYVALASALLSVSAAAAVAHQAGSGPAGSAVPAAAMPQQADGQDRAGGAKGEPSTQEQLMAVLAEATDATTAGTAGHAAVAVMDLTTGRSAAADDGHAFATASIVKVDILAALLLTAQDGDRVLTGQERRQAAAMIQVSDNAAATALWDAVGGADGLAQANRRLGLSETTPGSDGLWGLTQTTAADQLRLLRAVFTDDSPLSSASRDYAQQLMGGIAADQDWGISAAADDTSSARLKNGWLSRSETGLWVINSIGVVEKDGNRFLVAVLSDDQPSRAAGISLVETVAARAVSLLAPDSP